MAPKNDKPAYNKAADYNNDKQVSAAEQKRYDRENLTPDPLEESELAKSYGYALRIMKSDPQLWDLFTRAANDKKGQWTAERFTAELLNTDWWMENNEFARNAIAAEAMGGADWQATLETARLRVQEVATTEGAALSAEQIDDLAQQAIAGGWLEQGRGQLLTNAIAGSVAVPEGQAFMQGAAGDLQQRLEQVAARNGLRLSKGFFESAAQSVAMDLSTAEDAERQVREQAASLWPSFSQQILAGQDARDLASGYINTMAQEFEIDPERISLDDPLLRQAMTGMDDKGQPTVEGLWAFQQRLRNDPRWMQTKGAADQISGTARTVMEVFGLVK